jgi:uncharacterized protein (DUF2249 family)
MRAVVAATLLLLVACAQQTSQQVADDSFDPVIANPAFATGEGPILLIDEAHHNFHTADGRYFPFAELLRRDGYRVRSSSHPFQRDSLATASILVISNALHERNTEDWSLPTPSAFTNEEIAAVRLWVEEGGALLLIADHMPFPGAASDLAAAFGFRFNNGFAVDTLREGPIVFRRSDGRLLDHAVTSGRTDAELVDSVVTFAGQGFQAPREAEALLVFGPNVVSLMPETAWEFQAQTPRIPIVGWLQGAVRTFGEGRVAVFGEAAMFTSQRVGPQQLPMGMSSPSAPQNQQFLLNVVHWLSGLIETD